MPDDVIAEVRGMGASARMLVRFMYDETFSYNLGETGYEKVPYRILEHGPKEIMVSEPDENNVQQTYAYSVEGDTMYNLVDPNLEGGIQGVTKVLFKRVSKKVDQSFSMTEAQIDEGCIFMEVVGVIAEGGDARAALQTLRMLMAEE